MKNSAKILIYLLQYVSVSNKLMSMHYKVANIARDSTYFERKNNRVTGI